MSGIFRSRRARWIVLPLTVPLLALLLSGCADMLSWNDGGHRHRSSSHAAVDGNTTVVQRGDTLYSIAFRNNLDFHDLAAWNGISSDYTIYPGQRLRLQASGSGGRRATATRRPSVSAPPPVVASSGGITTTPERQAPARTAASPLDTVPPPGSPTFSRGRWQWPVKGQVVQRFDTGTGSKGINIAGPLGETVVAAAPGKVVYSGSALKGYGELVIIKHDERYLSAYGYNRKRLVDEGQWVKAGQAIAELGEGPEHRDEMHFEIRDRGKPVDPLSLLPHQ